MREENWKKIALLKKKKKETGERFCHPVCAVERGLENNNRASYLFVDG